MAITETTPPEHLDLTGNLVGQSPAGLNPQLSEDLPPDDQKLFHTYGWGPTAAPAALFLHRAFETQARSRPFATAIEHLKETVTYAELDHQANVIATELTERGVGRGDNVGIFAERSISMVAAMMAVLKVGAAYVPQHAGVAPSRQLTHIITKTEMSVVLTLSHLSHHVPEADSVEIVSLDSDIDYRRSEVSGSPDRALAMTDASPDDPCFVLFTSGTTGPPNGVVVTHRNVTNIVLTDPGNLGIEPGMRVAQLLSVAFDMAQWEIHGALSHGATLAIRGKDMTETAATADVIIATPSILASIDAEQCHHTQVVAVAGEPCPESLADTWSNFCRFHNSCGPTETTIVNTVKHYQGADDRLTIGTPTPNNTVYVLDEDLKPLPIGEVGEMWAGGDCVTAGYLGDDANATKLNADRYRDDPFLGGGRKMFRTRDLGRWNDDGELEHYGRTDDQVKIRGFRVELDSVSAVLEAVPSCTRAVTLKYDDRNLVAFAEPAVVDGHHAAEAVGQALPYYCVPAKVFTMAALPRTDRGKIDKAALRQLAEAELGELR